jgi:AraC-like DNA-binding protein/mannose-6-phosphate isomerase-like protein (cupin superfamily)
MDKLINYLHIMTMVEIKSPTISNYLPVDKDALQWGLYVMDAGHSYVPPHVPYPLGKHPDEYLFSWKTGRTLREYQLVYITQGRGMFETRATGRVRIEAGQVFLLFPGVWHRYRPVLSQGWHENWIGFNGDVADRIMRAFFSPGKAVIRIGQDQELQNLIRSVSGVMSKAPAGYQQIMAARTMEALALIRSKAMNSSPVDRNLARKVQQARGHLAQHYRDSVNMNLLARQLGLSYSRFRSVFKEYTGVSPQQYLINIRLNLARFWLTDSEIPISEIATNLGFSSVYYFSRLFKKKKGCSPSSFRERQLQNT